MSTLEKSVEKSFEGRKIREYLKEEMGLSSRLIRGAAMDKRISVNNTPVRMNYILKENDNIVINLNKKESQNIEPEKIDIDIVYEDSEIIVVNKGPNMVVHPTKRYQSGTLANALLYYFKETNQDCIVRLVSRLDMDTSGLIIIAKNQYAHMELSNNMQQNEIDKRYLALVHGHMEQMEGTIDKPIYRPELEGNMKRVVDERGQRSITHYKVIERLKDADLVECLLETGRTHQIRVHMSYIGHPLVGDEVYGKSKNNLGITGHLLHAKTLGFVHPVKGQYIEFNKDIPDEFQNVLNRLDMAENN